MQAPSHPPVLRPGPRWRPGLAVATAVVALHAAALLALVAPAEDDAEPGREARSAAAAAAPAASPTPAAGSAATPTRSADPALSRNTGTVQLRSVAAPMPPAAPPPPATGRPVTPTATTTAALPPVPAAAPAATPAVAPEPATAPATAPAPGPAPAPAPPRAIDRPTALATAPTAPTAAAAPALPAPGAPPPALPAAQPLPAALGTASLAPATLAANASANASANTAAKASAKAPASPPAFAATTAPAEAPPTPVYATRIPPAVQLSYDLQRGAVSGRGTLRWQPGADVGGTYRLLLQGSVLGLSAIDQTSTGGIDGAGIAPERFVDRRRGRSALAANFQRGPGLISFSGPSHTHVLRPGTQDRLSWMLQLPAIVEADPALQRVGAEIALFIAGARGDAEVWTFVVRSRDTLALPSGEVAGALHLQRASRPGQQHDTQVDVWLDPARHHLPVRLRTRSGDDAAVELRLSRFEAL